MNPHAILEFEPSAPAESPRRLEPRDLVYCPPMRCTLSAAVCARRQAARWPGLTRTGGGPKAKEAGLFEYCGSGSCKYGAAVRSALPPDYEPPAVIGLRGDIRAQWLAYRRWRRERLDAVPDIDHPPGSERAVRLVAANDPQDPGDE